MRKRLTQPPGIPDSDSAISWSAWCAKWMAAFCLPLLAGLLAGCALNFAEGQSLEAQKRWEEASISYRLAVIEDPDNEEYTEALQRTQKVVARENFELYRNFLAKKAFRKAFRRLEDASRQDPSYEPVRKEMRKWDRVLVGGQILFDFDIAQRNLTLADELKLIVRFNSPNPGETIDAEIDIDTGLFFIEDLLYDRPNEILTFYSINSIGVRLVHGRSRFQKFTSREYQRFVNIRVPVLDQIKGNLKLNRQGERKPVQDHRATLKGDRKQEDARVPETNPRFSLRIQDNRILVSVPGTRNDFTPRFLYMNKKDRRIFVDFGRYETRFDNRLRKWTLRRLPLNGPNGDYFASFSRNIALQPYFFYREGIFSYESDSENSG